MPHILKVVLAFIMLNCLCDFGWASIGRYTDHPIWIVAIGIIIFAILQAFVAEHQEGWKKK